MHDSWDVGPSLRSRRRTTRTPTTTMWHLHTCCTFSAVAPVPKMKHCVWCTQTCTRNGPGLQNGLTLLLLLLFHTANQSPLNQYTNMSLFSLSPPFPPGRIIHSKKVFCYQQNHQGQGSRIRPNRHCQRRRRR